MAMMKMYLSSENPGILRGQVDFVASLFAAVQEHMRRAAVFKGTCKTAQNELTP